MGNSWTQSTIGQLCTFVTSGGTPRKSKEEYYRNGTIPWLNTKEVKFERIYKTENHITEAGLRESSAKWIPANTVVVAMYGATAGKIGLAKIPMTTNQACCNLVIDDSIADYGYVYYYLLSNTDKLLDLANGAAQQNLNSIIVKGFPIPVPPLPEQRAIAHILGSLDDKIELNRRMNATLEAMAQALFQSWFVDFDPVIDKALAAGNPIPEPLQHRAQTRRELGERRKPLPADVVRHFPDRFVFTEELGWVPEGWEVPCFGEFARETRAKAGEKAVPEYSSTNGGLVPRSESFKKQLSVDKGKNKLVHRGDIVFGMSRQVLNFGVMYDPIGSVSSAYKVFQFEDRRVEPRYVERYIRMREAYYFNMLGSSSREGQSLSTASFLAAAVVVAPKVLQEYSLSLVGSQEKRDAVEQESFVLANLRDTLLPKLLSGELRVPDAERLVAEAL